MKHYNKKLLTRMLCLFFVFSAFGGGLLSSGKWLGGVSPMRLRHL